MELSQALGIINLTAPDDVQSLDDHLLRASVSGSYEKNEMRLAALLAADAPDNSVTLFDKGF